MYDYIIGTVTSLKNNAIVLDNNGIGVGGYYNCVKSHRDDQLTVVDKATLKAASLVLNPVREEYYLKEVK